MSNAIEKSKSEIIREYAEKHNIPLVEVKKLRVRRNAMTGLPFVESEDTPFACSPASETYWCS